MKRIPTWLAAPAAAVVTLFAPEALAQAGGAGESCQARSDCQDGLKCVNQVCQSDAGGNSGGGNSGGGNSGGGNSGGGNSGGGNSGGRSSSGGGGGGDLLEDELEGMRPHIGAIFGGGPTHSDRSDGEAVGSLLFAIKGGLFIDRLELRLEFAPATFVLNFNPDLPSVSLNGNVGYHIPLYKSISWPLRVGIGFVTPTFDGQAGDTELALRADLIGVSVLLDDQFLLDVHAPSWRIIVDTDGGGALFTYVFGLGFAWAPDP